MYDLLITNGTVIDGTGAAKRLADVAIRDGKIAAVGPDLPRQAKEIVDATGKIVTPGFIDLHTHYDGQVTWDDAMLPSAAHGVTTVIFGCCGVGFAPVRKGKEDWLITLMEGVEDIPGTALHDGIPWDWESYPEYLDFLGKRDYALNIAAHMPHATIRAYVMGDRAERDEPATESDLRAMADIVTQGMKAGALGFATSRVSLHRGSDGSLVPGTRADEQELVRLGEAMRDAGGGVLQIIPSGIVGGVEDDAEGSQIVGLDDCRDQFHLTQEIAMMRRIHEATGQPITFTFSENRGLGVEEYWKARGMIEQIIAAGENIRPQYAPRQVNSLTSLDTYHAFLARPSYRTLADLPVAERARAMADPAVKQAILSEEDIEPDTKDPMQFVHKSMQRNLPDTYELDDRQDFEPHPSRSIAAQAQAMGIDPLDLLYDKLIARDGRAILVHFATNYLDGDLEKLRDIINDEHFVMGLSDAGAHVCFICGGAQPTFALTHWARDRKRGDQVRLETVIRRLTGDPAGLYGLEDRGTIEAGKKADINVIDFDRLAIEEFRLAYDLPTGARRFLQDARGYELTLVNGTVVRRSDRDTGARPGHLLRGKAHEQVVA